MLTEKEIEHIAKLARLELTHEMRERMRKDLSSVLDYIALLETADTSGVEPLYQVTGLQNQTRPDMHRGDFSMDAVATERLIGQAPAQQGRFVKVKSVKAT
jgi:aspartyl-tRNA(Asn)/glutamyl-tRNA(Gln) amidotransferase subunit C